MKENFYFSLLSHGVVVVLEMKNNSDAFAASTGMARVNSTLLGWTSGGPFSDAQGWGGAPRCLFPDPRRVGSISCIRRSWGAFMRSFWRALAAKATLQKVRMESSFKKLGERQAALSDQSCWWTRKEKRSYFAFFQMRGAFPQHFIMKKFKHSKVKRTSRWTPIYSPLRFYY